MVQVNLNKKFVTTFVSAFLKIHRYETEIRQKQHCASKTSTQARLPVLLKITERGKKLDISLFLCNPCRICVRQMRPVEIYPTLRSVSERVRSEQAFPGTCTAVPNLPSC